jgi:hypothetical protein
MKTSLNLSYPGVGPYVTVFANAAPAGGLNSWGSCTDGGVGIGAKMIFTNGAKIASTRMVLNAGSLISIAGGGSAIRIAQGFPAGSFVELLNGADVAQAYPDGSKQTAVKGTMTLAGNSRYYASYPALFQTFAVITNGILQGNGRVENFPLFSNIGGNIWPGGSNGIGRLTVKGTNTLVTGTLVIELAGSSQFDQFYTSNGPLTAGGILRVSLINGFVPAHKNTFKILDFPSAKGAFASLDLPLGASKWITDALYTTGEITFQSSRGSLMMVR